MENMQVRVSLTIHRCYKCGGKLHKIQPPLYGWSYHCQGCQHLTSTVPEIQKAMLDKPEKTIGVVCAVPCRIEISEGT